MKNSETIPEEKQLDAGTKPVSVQQHKVHDEMWNDLAAVTSDRILKLRLQSDGWCIYLNPEFTVEGSKFSLDFNQEARRCQRAWITTMNNTLGDRNRRHHSRTSDFLTRQLAHNGMLMINGKPIAPHDWTSMEAAITA